MTAAAILSALLWLILLVLPWRPWGTRERLDARRPSAERPDEADLSDVVVLIPARNEAGHIAGTLQAVRAQGRGHRIVVVDDRSQDGTAAAARVAGGADLRLVRGEPLPEGWTGKLWALEQGRRLLERPLVLLLDADIELAPGLLVRLRERLRRDRLALVSVLPAPRLAGVWERWVMPAYVYFFKLLYPFGLVNRPNAPVAAAAGGCILLETRALETVGGFAAWRDAVIDDCALAARVKRRAGGIWLGLTRSAHSRRPLPGLAAVRALVTRTAFSQLHYAIGWLLLCTLLMLLLFAVPVLGVLSARPAAVAAGGLALTAMLASFVPVLRFYGLAATRAVALPVIAVAFLLMTWESALRYWGGQRTRWKGRTYARKPAADGGLDR